MRQLICRTESNLHILFYYYYEYVVLHEILLLRFEYKLESARVNQYFFYRIRVWRETS